MEKIFAKFSERAASAAGNQYTFVVAILFIAAWALSGPFFGYSDTWQLIVNTSTTIITFLMVFLIQNSQNRDSCALQAKLDEILHAVKNAREDVIGIEHLPLKELERLRDEIEKRAGKSA
ncbi:low affinity iron permease family protein [Ochrobactrum sp. Q0168]|uniref:low affinity iron permease family protein n=1 Tax=Ochrobactrum sp. Q0168 TaxID=2793241 RepID=UPI0018EBB23D|nr:low affinity iron permease family protein [Ochrobactrum sp. Q0168]